MKAKISDRLCKAMGPGEVIRDSELRGFLARKSKTSGIVSFNCYVETKPKPFFKVVGRSDLMTATDARALAKDELARHWVDRGKAKPTHRTIDVAIDEYLADADRRLDAGKLSPLTRRNYNTAKARLSEAFLSGQLRDLAPEKVVQEFDRISTERGAKAAEATISFITGVVTHHKNRDPSLILPKISVLVHAHSGNLNSDLPVLSPEEMPAWFAKLKTLSPLRQELHLLALLSGIRRDSLLSLRRSSIAADRLTIHVDRAKGRNGGKPFDLVTTPQILDCWDRAIVAGDFVSSGSQWLFPGGSYTGQISSTHEENEIGLLTFHSLRRSYTSIGAGLGVPELLLSMLLNHGASTVTAGYVRSSALGSALIEAQGRISAAIMAACVYTGD